MSRRRWGDAAVYAAAVGVACVALYRARLFHEDDAFITLRYAARWIAGQGPTWTDGERVEGYSDPSWLLQVALLGRLGVPLPAAARGLGVAYLGALFAVFRRARASPGSALALATAPGVAVWSMGGLETVSFAFWIVLGAWATFRVVHDGSRGILAGIALGVASLTRPEGLAVGLVALAWVASSRRWRALPAMAGGLLLPAAGWEIFRLAYYGDLVANSVRAKMWDRPFSMSLRGGLEYLGASAGAWGPALGGALLAVGLAGRRDAAWMLALGLPIVAALLAAGGDHMVGTRLLVPVLVLALFTAGFFSARARGSSRRRALVSVVLVGVALVSAPLALASDREDDRAAAQGREAGRFLERSLPAGTLVAAATAGSTPFEAPSLRFIDTLGLNDRVIAEREAPAGVTLWQSFPGHGRGDGAYVLSRDPDVILLGGAAGSLGYDPRQWFLTDHELLALPGFRDRYRPVEVRVSPSLTLVAFARRGSEAARVLGALGRKVRAPWDVTPRHPVRAPSAVLKALAFPAR